MQKKINVDKLKLNQIKYVCIEGNIGSGKSVLAKSLAKELNAIFVPESFEENNLLPLFYERPKHFSFPLEYSFLISRFEQLYNVFASPNASNKLIVADYSIYKCLWFAKVNLNKKDFLFFEKHFNAILSSLPKPDLIIYITTDIENLQKNIRKRGREYEQSISSSYLRKIEKQYKKGIKQIKVDNVLEVNVENYYPKLQADIIEFVNDFIKNLK
ncbi:MAG: deoxynucleoside kinase [Bacteroidota bacterium]|nr:deoxynucleoside kinase [Bacteroidota bacterium]